MSDDELKNYVLAEIEKILNRNEKSLKEFSTLPFPDRRLIDEWRNMLIQDELSYDRVLLAEESDKLIASLNDDQRRVFQTIINTTSKYEGGMFFVYGFRGTVKTLIWKALSSIPDDLLIKDSDDPIGAIIDSTYSFLSEKRRDQTYLQERVILAATLDYVGKVNEYMLTSCPGEEVCYLSSDLICKADHYSTVMTISAILSF